MITILKNTLICYLALLGLSTIGALFICLDKEYSDQCPPQVTLLISHLVQIPQVNEVRIMLIPILKQLPHECISVLIWSSIMMATAFLLSLTYVAVKFTYGLLMGLLKLIIVLFAVSLIAAFVFNYNSISLDIKPWLKYLQLFPQ